MISFFLFLGVLVGHYLQKVTENLALGAELVYQRGPNIPGKQMSIYTLGGKYAGTPHKYLKYFCGENLHEHQSLYQALENNGFKSYKG